MINGIFITKVIIDPHYEEKHSGSISDELILDLVKLLGGKVLEAVDYERPFSYFVSSPLELHGRKYKLVWLLEDNEVYLGVVNAHRRR